MHNFLGNTLGIMGEIQGVLHSKLLVFDSYTIVTGANLSHNYFTTRQDRYYIIQECEPFADYCEDYVNSRKFYLTLVIAVSYQTDSVGDISKPRFSAEPKTKKVEYMKDILHQFKMFKYDNRVKIPSGYELNIDEYFENLEKYNNNYKKRENIENLIEFKNTQDEFLKLLVGENGEEKLNFLKRLTDEKKEETKDNSPKSNIAKQKSKNNRVLLFPTFQFSAINQNDDKEIITNLLNSDYFDKIKFATGYFNMPIEISEIIKNSKYSFSSVTSSPRANSFYKSGFFKKNIPYLYRRYQSIFLSLMKERKDIEMFEFEKEGWSFHSKGLWFYEKDKKFPSMTVIGSSNYNYRAYERDVESQLYVYSFCDDFNQRMQHEVEDNFTFCSKVSLDDINKDKDVKIKLRHKIMAKMLKKYL